MDISSSSSGDELDTTFQKQSKKRSKTGSSKITLDDMFEIILNLCDKLNNNLVYTHIKNELTNLHITKEEINVLHQQISKKVKFQSSDSFLSTYYGYIVKDGHELIPFLKENTAKILLIKLADLLFPKHLEKEKEVIDDTSFCLSNRQLSGLQYLGGYVLHNLDRKIKNSKRWNLDESQITMAILEASREEDTTQHINQQLVVPLNRGGLWFISEEAEQMFIICEKYFMRKTGGKPVQNVKINKVTSDLFNFSYVQGEFLKIVDKDDIDIPKDVANNTLFSIIQLYIRIRMFSLVKDYVQQQRSASAKELSLRKTLKRGKEV